MLLSRRNAQIGVALAGALAAGACSTTPSVPVSETTRLVDAGSACSSRATQMEGLIAQAQKASEIGIKHVVVKRATGMRCGTGFELLVVSEGDILQPGEEFINGIDGHPKKFKRPSALGDEIMWAPVNMARSGQAR